MNTDYKQRLIKELKDYYSAERRFDVAHPSMMRIIFPYVSDKDFENSKKIVDETFNVFLLTTNNPTFAIPCFGFYDLTCESPSIMGDRIHTIDYFLRKLMAFYEESFITHPTENNYRNISALTIRTRTLHMFWFRSRHTASDNTAVINDILSKVTDDFSEKSLEAAKVLP